MGKPTYIIKGLEVGGIGTSKPSIKEQVDAIKTFTAKLNPDIKVMPVSPIRVMPTAQSEPPHYVRHRIVRRMMCSLNWMSFAAVVLRDITTDECTQVKELLKDSNPDMKIERYNGDIENCCPEPTIVDALTLDSLLGEAIDYLIDERTRLREASTPSRAVMYGSQLVRPNLVGGVMAVLDAHVMDNEATKTYGERRNKIVDIAEAIDDLVRK